MSKIRIIGKNISFMAFNRIVAVIVSFFIFPFIVKHVGKEVYGVYLMVMTVTGYFGILDLGVMSALTKYVSEYTGKKDHVIINKIVNASFSFYVLIGAVISILLFACAACFPLFFKVDPSNTKVVRELFTVAAISAIFVWPLNTFRGTVQGLSLWNIDAVVNIFVQVLNALTAFILLSSGYGIVQLFVVSQLLTIIGSAVLYYVGRKKIGINIAFPYIHIATFKLIFNFSIFAFLSSILNIFLFQIHNIIIGYFVSMSAVTVYAVAYNIQSYFRAINSTLGAPPWTMASEMEGRGDLDGQKKLLIKGTKYMSAVLIPIVLIMLFFVEPFIKYWMGPDFYGSVIPARIIIIFWLFNGTIELASSMLSAKGIIRRPLFIQLGAAVFNILITLSFVKILGISAVALGLSLSMILVSSPFILRLSLKSLGVTLREYYDGAIKYNLPLYGAVTFLSAIISNYLYPKNIYMTLFEMAAIYITSLAAYYFTVMQRHEKDDILKLLGLKTIFQ